MLIFERIPKYGRQFKKVEREGPIPGEERCHLAKPAFFILCHVRFVQGTGLTFSRGGAWCPGLPVAS
jgi:hypothetical protein